MMLLKFTGGSLNGAEIVMPGPIRSVYYVPAGPNPRRQISPTAWPRSAAYRAVAIVRRHNAPDHMIFALVGPDGEVGS